MSTCPRFLTRALVAAVCTAATVFAVAVPAGATPSVPMVPSSKGLIPASAAMPKQGEAPHVTTDCSSSGQSGGQIAQSTVLTRALVWVTQNVPYTGQCASEPGGNYRLDCSGFVSMAWGLSTSLSTYNFNPAINGGDTRFLAISAANLQPGDAVVADNSTAHHIALFTGWGSNDNGQHRYANLSEESDFNVGTIAVTNQDLRGSYWGMFTPIRYTNVNRGAGPGAAGVTTVRIGSSVNVFWIGSTGDIMQTAYNGGWQTTDLGTIGTPSGAPAVTNHDGRTDLFVVTAAGNLYQRYDAGAGWQDWQQIGSGWSPGVAATWTGTMYNVYGHNSAGHLLHMYYANGTWSFEDLGGVSIGTPGATYHDGHHNVWVVSPVNHLIYQRSYSAGVWSGWIPVGTSADYGYLGTTAVWTGAFYHLFSLGSDNSLEHAWYTNAWYGPTSLRGVCTGSVGVTYLSLRYDVFAPSSTGGVYQLTYLPTTGWGSWHRIV